MRIGNDANMNDDGVVFAGETLAEDEGDVGEPLTVSQIVY